MKSIDDILSADEDACSEYQVLPTSIRECFSEENLICIDFQFRQEHERYENSHQYEKYCIIDFHWLFEKIYMTQVYKNLCNCKQVLLFVDIVYIKAISIVFFQYEKEVSFPSPYHYVPMVSFFTVFGIR